MKVNGINTTKVLLNITLIGIIIILIFTLIILNKNGCQFSSNSITTLLGVIISCASLIITAYFVVMAINAYGHIEKIEELEKSVTTTSQQINEQQNGENELFKTISKNIRDKDMNRQVQLREYRIAYINPDSYDEEKRIRFLLNLANLGDASDIKPIEGISNNKKESEKIRETAKYVVKELRRRFPNA